MDKVWIIWRTLRDNLKDYTGSVSQPHCHVSLLCLTFIRIAVDFRHLKASMGVMEAGGIYSF